jgi:hypothetical protein
MGAIGATLWLMGYLLKMPPPILLGKSDFEQLRLQGGLYVDKSTLISTVLEASADVQLYPRPRRFGKTLNLSMLRYFLEASPDRSALFADLAVWQDAKARAHFQQHPVIYLSFKDVKVKTWGEAWQMLQPLIAEEIKRLLPILCHPSLPAIEQERWKSLAYRQAVPDVAVLRELSLGLRQSTGKLVVILIDEYDAPLLTAWEYGYFEEAVSWFRAFLSAGLKDNANLFRGVLTGVLRVGRESLFSGLNNVKVYSLVQQEVPEPFGFSEEEVVGLLKQFGREGEQGAFQRWYNGYVFGGVTVYNPWSILNALMSPRAPLQAWWLNTAENTVIHRLLLGNVAFQQEVATLLQGGTVEREVDENVVLRDISGEKLWGFLLFSGYLKAEAVRWDERGRLWVMLKIPNLEVQLVWEESFSTWLTDGLGRLEPLHRALLTGDAAAVQELLETLLLRHVSTWDVQRTQEEAFYHAFVLGLLVTLEKTHRVRSNREVGKGRADVQLLPREAGKPGVVLEFKRLEEGKTLKAMARKALKQIETSQYALELQEAKAAPVFCFGIAFSGKEVVVMVG